MYSIKDNLNFIGQRNPDLADELRVLPEIQGSRAESSKTALNNLSKIYLSAPDRFDRMFKKMNDIGRADCRNYCSPLQAFFWLVQDEKYKISGMLLGLNITKIINRSNEFRPKLFSEVLPPPDHENKKKVFLPYSLNSILDAAWNTEPLSMISSHIYSIIERIEDKEKSEEYNILVKRRSTIQLQGYIIDDFLKNRESFNMNDWPAIEKAIRLSRWKLFYTVADRLNSPELISYYINKFFYFKKEPSSGVYITFYTKQAQCTNAAYFAEFMLKRAGYNTFIRSVKWNKDPWNGLHTGAGIILDDGRYLLVSNYTGINKMSDPAVNIESLDQKMSCGKKILESKWGAYFPPRYY